MNQKIPKQKIDAICHELSERVEDLLDHLGLEYSFQDNYVCMPCPIHGGDNPTACTVYVDGDAAKGNWYCWTHQCHEEYFSTLLGFIRGCLESEADEKVTFNKVVDFALDFLESSMENIKEKKPVSGTDRRASVIARLEKSQAEPSKKITRKLVRANLKIPAQYYVKRGYKKETLDKFDVGTSKNQGRAMSGRAVVPVYDDSYEFMVGCAGREIRKESRAKWVNSKGFNSGLNLYGYWFAKDKIKETGTVIIVEGQGDVWRLYEAGITNCVGIFGCNITDAQIIKLEYSGALNIIVLLDTDEAGIKGREKIKQKCGDLYNLHFPEIKSSKDVGEMSVEEIQELLVPQINEFELIFNKP